MSQSKVPEGYRKANVELSGFWSPQEGPIHGRLIGGFRFKNSKRRLTTVYMIRLAEPCNGSAKGINGGLEECEFKKGEVVGVFHSGGLQKLQNLYGCMVHIAGRFDEDGEFKTKTVPQGEMKLFDINFKGEEQKVPIEDRATEDATEQATKHGEIAEYEDDTDIPF